MEAIDGSTGVHYSPIGLRTMDENEKTIEKKRPYERTALTLAKDIFRVVSTMFGEEDMIELAAHKIEEAMEILATDVENTTINNLEIPDCDDCERRNEPSAAYEDARTR